MIRFATWKQATLALTLCVIMLGEVVVLTSSIWTSQPHPMWLWVMWGVVLALVMLLSLLTGFASLCTSFDLWRQRRAPSRPSSTPKHHPQSDDEEQKEQEGTP